MKTPRLLSEDGIAKANSGDLGGALKCFEAVVELEPHEHSAWFNIGIIPQRRGSPDKAVLLQMELDKCPQRVIIQRDGDV